MLAISTFIFDVINPLITDFLQLSGNAKSKKLLYITYEKNSNKYSFKFNNDIC